MKHIIGRHYFLKIFSTIDGIHNNTVYYHSVYKPLGIYKKKTLEEHGVTYWLP